MKIGNINVKSPVFLAPMAGVTDKPYRIICKKMGAGLVYTEFVSADGIIRENIKTLDMIKFSDYERPIGVQIFGDNPDTLGDSAAMIEDQFKPDIIDINFGCPVPKVTKRGAGSAALKDLSLMYKIVDKVIKCVSDTPITVKMRSGWDSSNIVAIDAGVMLQDIGIKALTLHARTTKQSYSGNADWSLIKQLKDSLSIPIIGNGDVNDINSYIRMIKETNCDAVMIGRGALGNPWIFKQINLYLNNKNSNITPTITDIVNISIEHINLLEQNKSSTAAINLSKKHLNFYLKNFPNSVYWRKELMRCQDIKKMKEVLLNLKKEDLKL